LTPSDLDIDLAAAAAKPVVRDLERRAHELRRLVLPLLVLVDDLVGDGVLRALLTDSPPVLLKRMGGYFDVDTGSSGKVQI
jgi:hypothetical protein